MQEQEQVPNPDDMATCRQCEQLFDLNASESENRCLSCVQSRCDKCGGPIGGKAIIRKNLGDEQGEFTSSLTGARISFVKAMRERGLCRSCVDRICRGCGDAPVQPPDTKCDWCREPDKDEDEDDESEYVCPSCGAFNGYVSANVNGRSPGSCEVCDWRDACPTCGESDGFLPEFVNVPDDVYLAADCTACGWHDVEGDKALEQNRNIWGPQHAEWIAKESVKIADRTRGITPPSCGVCHKPMEFQFGLDEVGNYYSCSNYRDEAHRTHPGKHSDADKWIAEQRARQELTPVDDTIDDEVIKKRKQKIPDGEIAAMAVVAMIMCVGNELLGIVAFMAVFMICTAINVWTD